MILKIIKKVLRVNTKTGDSLRRGDVIAYDKLKQSVVFLRFDSETNSWDRLIIANTMTISSLLSYHDSNGQSVSYYGMSLLFKEFAQLIADLSGFQGVEEIHHPHPQFYQFAFRLI